MKKIPWLILLVFALPGIVQAEQLLKTNTSWDGGDIHYPEGSPEITAIILRLQEDQISKFHCHPIPTLGYILKGTVEVETKAGKKVTLKPGDAAVEVMRTVHRGIAVEGDVEILVFYAGAEGIPTTVLPDSEQAEQYCDL